MSWQQVYDPFGSMVVSTALAAIPVVVMLVCLGFLHMKAHLAAGLGLLSALLIAIVAFGMPAEGHLMGFRQQRLHGLECGLARIEHANPTLG